ncbi:hypothetical protein PS874_00475 [Pseudomonas fluorescens]|nr:hypothetical protein PS874_00475 [Pseudomonas fluorescens]
MTHHLLGAAVRRFDLLAKAVLQATLMLDVPAPSRASPLPHDLGGTQILCSLKIPVGAGLPAMAADQPPQIYNACHPPPSALYKAILACNRDNRSCTFKSCAAYKVRWVSSTVSKSSAPAS